MTRNYKKVLKVIKSVITSQHVEVARKLIDLHNKDVGDGFGDVVTFDGSMEDALLNIELDGIIKDKKIDARLSKYSNMIKGGSIRIPPVSLF